MYSTPKPETSLLSRAMDRLPAFSPAAPVRTRRNCRKPFLFMHLLHNLRTPRGWGRHPRASSPDFSLFNAIPFRIRTYKKTGVGVGSLFSTSPLQLRFSPHRSQVTEHRQRPLCVSALSFSVLCLSTFNLQLSTIPLSENFYPPASDLRHNPAAQGHRSVRFGISFRERSPSISQSGRIQ
jgi:hypothetical protein